MSTDKIAAHCTACGRAMRRYLLGDEIPCVDCSGALCEGCCDKAKAELAKARAQLHHLALGLSLVAALGWSGCGEPKPGEPPVLQVELVVPATLTQPVRPDICARIDGENDRYRLYRCVDPEEPRIRCYLAGSTTMFCLYAPAPATERDPHGTQGR